MSQEGKMMSLIPDYAVSFYVYVYVYMYVYMYQEWSFYQHFGPVITAYVVIMRNIQAPQEGRNWNKKMIWQVTFDV